MYEVNVEYIYDDGKKILKSYDTDDFFDISPMIYIENPRGDFDNVKKVRITVKRID